MRWGPSCLSDEGPKAQRDAACPGHRAGKGPRSDQSLAGLHPEGESARGIGKAEGLVPGKDDRGRGLTTSAPLLFQLRSAA